MGLLKRAHAGAYRFPPDFAGFTAAVHTSASPDVGRLEARGKRDFDLSGGDDWAREQVASILGHRWASDFHTEGDGRYSHREEHDGDPAGTLVHLDGDPMASAYRITSEDEIAEVHRTAGDTKFTIVTSGGLDTGEGRLPQHFSVYYWSVSSGRLTRVEQFRDRYVEVGTVWLPQRRVITTVTDTGLSTRVLSFADHQLREP